MSNNREEAKTLVDYIVNEAFNRNTQEIDFSNPTLEFLRNVFLNSDKENRFNKEELLSAINELPEDEFEIRLYLVALVSNIYEWLTVPESKTGFLMVFADQLINIMSENDGKLLQFHNSSLIELKNVYSNLEENQRFNLEEMTNVLIEKYSKSVELKQFFHQLIGQLPEIIGFIQLEKDSFGYVAEILSIVDNTLKEILQNSDRLPQTLVFSDFEAMRNFKTEFQNILPSLRFEMKMLHLLWYEIYDDEPYFDYVRKRLDDLYNWLEQPLS